MNLEERIMILEGRLNNLEKSDRWTFQKMLQIFDGRNIQLGVTTGTKIGTAASQKLSVYGATPIVQVGAISAPSAPSGTYTQAEAQSAVTAINSIRTALKSFGITA